MSDTSKIEWTDATWNPVRGCSICSKGCLNCYAMRQAHRFSGPGQPYEGLTQMTRRGPIWSGQVRTVPELLDWPLHRKKPRMIFVDSMSDLFHPDVPDDFIDQVFAVMCKCCARNEYQSCYAHTFQILTKRADRMLQYVTDPRRVERVFVAGHKTPLCGRSSPPPWPLPNVWLGISAEDQKTFDERWPHLRETPAAVRIVSLEPLLGWIDIGDALTDCMGAPLGLLHQVIAGGESGPKARPSHPDNFRSLRDQCQAAGVPFFFKQWGEWAPETVATGECGAEHALYIDTDGSTRPAKHGARAGSTTIQRVGKRAAGRLLDGRTHDEYPA